MKQLRADVYFPFFMVVDYSADQHTGEWNIQSHFQQFLCAGDILWMTYMHLINLLTSLMIFCSETSLLRRLHLSARSCVITSMVSWQKGPTRHA